MKIVLKLVSFIVMSLVFVGCAQQPEMPSEPIGKSFTFKQINLNFMQKHFPKTKQYQSKEQIANKLNDEIIAELKNNDKLNQTSDEQIIITVDFKRVFVGEDLPFESLRGDSIGGIKIGYDIKIVRGDKILRHLKRENLIYDPGFLGNFKTIAAMNNDDSFENDAIKALGKNIVEQIVNMR